MLALFIYLFFLSEARIPTLAAADEHSEDLDELKHHFFFSSLLIFLCFGSNKKKYFTGKVFAVVNVSKKHDAARVSVHPPRRLPPLATARSASAAFPPFRRRLPSRTRAPARRARAPATQHLSSSSSSSPSFHLGRFYSMRTRQVKRREEESNQACFRGGGGL